MEVAKLKKLLGIEDESKNEILEFVIANVEEIIKNYCHVDEVPEGQPTAWQWTYIGMKIWGMKQQQSVLFHLFPRGIPLPHSGSMWMTISRIQC